MDNDIDKLKKLKDNEVELHIDPTAHRVSEIELTEKKQKNPQATHRHHVHLKKRLLYYQVFMYIERFGDLENQVKNGRRKRKKYNLIKNCKKILSDILIFYVMFAFGCYVFYILIANNYIDILLIIPKLFI